MTLRMKKTPPKHLHKTGSLPRLHYLISYLIS